MSFTISALNNTMLPTKYDVINYFLYLRHNTNPNRKLSAFKQEAFRSITLLWERAGIPIISVSGVRKRLDKLLDDYYKLVKSPLKCNVNEWNKLFSISRCKCGIERNVPCSCTASDKIPDDAKDFFIDQWGPRLMTLDNVYHMMSMKNCGVQTCSIVAPSKAVYTEFNSIGYQPGSDEELEFEENVGDSSEKIKTTFTVADISLRNFSSALDRSDTSVRYGALLATMLIKDLKLSIAAKAKEELSAETAENICQFFEGLIINKNKIFRERVKFRKEAKAAAKCHQLLKCISFDGKKEPTLKKVTEANVTRNIVLNEEHITIVKEPDSKFIGYATPTDSSALGIQRSIVDYLSRENFNLDDLVAISCDGTATNTGYKSGVIVRMERHLQRPLQWFVCLFHFNELPFNALLRSLLGKQKGPGIWPGSIGEGFQNCIHYSVKQNFERITMGEMPANIDGWNIRGDQLYLYRMVRAVHTGECDEKLASEKPGAICKARWLTTASRILRFYMTCTQPSMVLRKLAQFVVKVYAPFWFLVKSQPLAIHGSRNVFLYICWIRQLPKDIQEVIRPFIENNGYFFHPENILLSMITDPDQLVRSDAYDKILSARNEATGSIRQMFGPPVHNFINFDSDSYFNMIDWKQFELTEPPCLQFFSQEQLEAFQFSEEIIDLPGPPRIPLFGSYLFMMMTNFRYLHKAVHTFTKWFKSDIIGLYMGPYPVIVVHSAEAIREVLHRPEFDGRPQLFLGEMRQPNSEIAGIFFTQGPDWKQQRRFVLRHLRDFGFGRRFQELELVIQEELNDMLDLIRNGPKYEHEKDFVKEGGYRILLPYFFSTFSANSDFHIIFNERYKRSEQDELWKLTRHGIQFLRRADDYGKMLSIMPWLRFIFPKWSSYNAIRESNFFMYKFFDDLVDRHMKTYDDSHDRNFIDMYIREMKEAGATSFSRNQLVMSLVDFTLPAFAAVGMQLAFLVQYLLLYPEVQKKIQQEIDAVVGGGRLPTLNDRQFMPYTEATLREVMRIETLVPSDIPHRAQRDTELMGYKVPENTVVMVSLYALHNDKRVWGDPENFRPERFLDAQGKLCLKKDVSLPFGAGKRLCAGETFARNMLFLIISTLCQNFNVILGPNDKLPNLSSTLSGFATSPRDFWVQLEERI